MAKTSLLKILLLLVCFSTGNNKIFAQKVHDTIQFYYNYNREIEIEKIEREHIPLDGARVSMIPFRESKLFGFVDKKSGKKIIKPRFEEVFAVYEEGAIVKENDNYGLVDRSGKMIIPPQFNNLFKEGNIYHGLYSAYINKSDTAIPKDYQYGWVNYYFNGNGKVLFEERTHDQRTFTDNDSIAWFRYGRQYTIRGRSGKVWKKFVEKDRTIFRGIADNLLIFSRSKGYQTIYTAYDVHDSLVFSLTLYKSYMDKVYKLSDNVFALEGIKSYLFSDKDGNTLPYESSFWAGGLKTENGLIQVKDTKTELSGFLNQNGEMVIPCIYQYLGNFKDGLVAFSGEKGAIGFMDANHKIVLEPKYEPANWDRLYLQENGFGFSDGLCFVKKFSFDKMEKLGGYISDRDDEDIMFEYVYIDKSGKEVIKLPDDVEMAGDFNDGLSPVLKKDKCLGFIDKKGKMVITCKYELAVAGAYPMPFIVVPKFINGYAYIKSFKGYIDKNGKEYFSGERLQDHYDFSH